MTENDQRFAIAETQGYVWYRHPISRSDGCVYRFLALPAAHEFEQSPEWLVRADGTDRVCAAQYMEVDFGLQDYLKDWNAMAPVVATLTFEQWRMFLIFLSRSEVLPNQMSMEQFHDCWNASIDRMAKAYLQTKGRWVEGGPGR